jgi:hypothetical protein
MTKYLTSYKVELPKLLRRPFNKESSKLWGEKIYEEIESYFSNDEAELCD